MKTVRIAAILFVVFGVILGCGARQNEYKWVRGPMPEGGNFDGVYQTDFGRLELSVEGGSSVIGFYESDQYSGRIQGRVKNNLLEFTWTQWNQEMRGKTRETRGKGVFQYVVETVEIAGGTKDYTSLEGWWGYDKGKMTNRWNGVKLNRSKKKIKPFESKRFERKEEDQYGKSAGFSDTEETSSGGSGFEESEPEPEPEPEPEEKEEEGGLADIF